MRITAREKDGGEVEGGGRGGEGGRERERERGGGLQNQIDAGKARPANKDANGSVWGRARNDIYVLLAELVVQIACLHSGSHDVRSSALSF